MSSGGPVPEKDTRGASVLRSHLEYPSPHTTFSSDQEKLALKKKYLKKFMSMSDLPACLALYHACAWYPQGPGKHQIP